MSGVGAEGPANRVYMVTFTDRYDVACAFWDRQMGLSIFYRWDDTTGRGTIWNITGNAFIEIKEVREPWVSGMQVAIEVDGPGSVDEWFERMVAADVPVDQGPGVRPWGHYNATVIDPCGIRVTCFADVASGT